MSPELSRTIDRLRQPEYTGENRCIPCTTVNLVIAVVLTVLAGVVFLPAAVAVFALSVAAIYLRGYLVPGTPTLTKRYFPDWLLAKFDKGPAAARPGPAVEAGDVGSADVEGEPGTAAETDAQAKDGTEPEPIENLDPEQVFLEREILVPCGDSPEREHADKPEDDLCLPPSVEDAWRAEIRDLRDGDRVEQLAAFLETDPDVVTIDEAKYAIARVNGRLAARWESDAAMLADIAAERVLAERLPDWERYSLQQQSQLANGLRAFIEACPACDGDISLDEETVESCCRSHQVYAITCNDCDARILEVADHS